MNTTPDDLTLALWLDDGLPTKESSLIEAWAATRPDQIDAREKNRQWKRKLRQAIPAAIDPPSPALFNARIHRMIRQCEHHATHHQAENVTSIPSHKKRHPWLMPTAAAAGMVIAFWLGGNTASDTAGMSQNSPDVYVPESGVNAQWLSRDGELCGVIILSGVAAIPDTTDFSQTVYLPIPREIDRTAIQRGDDSPVH